MERPPRQPSSFAPFVIAGSAGLALWLLASVMTAKREPWDATGYWVFAYPLAIAICAALAYRYPQRPWRWSLTLFEAQLMGMWIRNGEPGNLWPMAIVLFGVVAMPAMLAGKIAARVSRSRAGEED